MSSDAHTPFGAVGQQEKMVNRVFALTLTGIEIDSVEGFIRVECQRSAGRTL